jgi:hypothetical protein
MGVEECLEILLLFRITMKEYEDMGIKVGDRVGMENNKVDSAGI